MNHTTLTLTIPNDAGEQLKHNDKLDSVAPFIFISWRSSSLHCGFGFNLKFSFGIDRSLPGPYALTSALCIYV